MVASIVAVAQPSNLPPRVQLTVAGVTTGAGTCTIVRTDASGAQFGVRGAEPFTLVSGGGVVFDYEIPYGQTSTYSAVDSTGTTVASTTKALAATQAWLVHPTFPALSCPLYGVSLGDVTAPTGVVNQPVPGRKNPIPIGDGQRKSDQGQLTFRTKDASALSAMNALLAGTSSLLVQIVFPWTTASEWFYISTGDETRSRVSQQFGDARRKWGLPYTVVDCPDGTVQSEWDWANVAAGYTWQDVKDKFATWTGVLTGVEGT